jgi:hypothetical protein
LPVKRSSCSWSAGLKMYIHWNKRSA